jgi:hypothetical protein
MVLLDVGELYPGKVVAMVERQGALNMFVSTARKGSDGADGRWKSGGGLRPVRLFNGCRR